jgi:hypothetical protein
MARHNEFDLDIEESEVDEDREFGNSSKVDARELRVVHLASLRAAKTPLPLARPTTIVPPDIH